MLGNNSQSYQLSKSNVHIKGWILWFFGLCEIVLYNCEISEMQYLFAITAYGFILISFLQNRKNGIMYFISFNLLSLGIFNFWGITDVISYWGLRVGGLSFNIIFTALLAILIVIQKRGTQLFPKDKYTIFLFVFYGLTLIWGIIVFLYGRNYSDNLISDILTFSPIFFYALMVKELTRPELMFIVTKVFTITIYALLLAFLLNKRYEYSHEWFIVGNTMSFLSPIGAIILWKYYSKINMVIFLIIMILLIVSEAYFTSGKTILMIGALSIWLLLLRKHINYIGIISLIILFPILITGLDTLSGQLDNKIIAFKITQITQVFKDPQIFALAAEFSSMGNIIAEAITLGQFYIENPTYLLFGQGMGAGIPDYFGFLTPFAGNSGYAEVDASRNNFFNLHIAPYKVLANGGLIMFIWYCRILYDLFRARTAITFMAFLMLFLMFYVSKEFMLLTYCLLRIVALSDQTKHTRI